MNRAHIAQITAKYLFDIKAVNFRADEPYTFTSGLKSPVYINCRDIISYPKIRNDLMNFGADIIREHIGEKNIQAVAGGETAGIPYGAFMAHIMDKPMIYVRKKPKGHGLGKQIEGIFQPNDTILLVEDQATDGASKVNFVNAIRREGGQCKDCFVIYYYDIFDKQALQDMGIAIHALCTAKDLLQYARDNKLFTTTNMNQVEEFLNAPLAWSKARGGADNVLGS